MALAFEGIIIYTAISCLGKSLFFAFWSIVIGFFGSILPIVALKSFYNGIKDDVKLFRELRMVRKRYGSDKEIQEDISRVKERIESLNSQLDKLNEEDNNLNELLSSINREILLLQKKLYVVKETFISSTFNVEGDRIDEKLNLEYEESHVEEKVQAIQDEDEKASLGKRFVVTKKLKVKHKSQLSLCFFYGKS